MTEFRFPVTRRSKDLAIAVFAAVPTGSTAIRKAVRKTIQAIEATPETEEDT